MWTTQLCLYILSWAFPGGTEVKNQPAKAGDARDPDLIPGSGRSPEEEMATHSSVLAWRIPGMEEPGRLLSMGSHRVRHNWSDLACMHALEKEMATHSSVLAWRISGTEGPDGFQSCGYRS